MGDLIASVIPRDLMRASSNRCIISQCYAATLAYWVKISKDEAEGKMLSPFDMAGLSYIME